MELEKSCLVTLVLKSKATTVYIVDYNKSEKRYEVVFCQGAYRGKSALLPEKVIEKVKKVKKLPANMKDWPCFVLGAYLFAEYARYKTIRMHTKLPEPDMLRTKFSSYTSHVRNFFSGSKNNSVLVKNDEPAMRTLKVRTSFITACRLPSENLSRSSKRRLKRKVKIRTGEKPVNIKPYYIPPSRENTDRKIIFKRKVNKNFDDFLPLQAEVKKRKKVKRVKVNMKDKLIFD